MNSNELKLRTKKFAIRIIKMIDKLPKSNISDVIGKQLLRSATSVGANYRAACRARSKQEFISKIKIVEEESDETLYWLELIQELKLFRIEQISELIKEADELTAIFTSTAKSAKKNVLEEKSKITNPKSKIDTGA
ncbi:MAG: four helix bundle protein [Ignavibacteria bacterium]|nr:four helix bundle protein [Ignavibacteria bacterium]